MNNGYIDELGDIIKSQDRLLAFGRKTKTALEVPQDVTALDFSKVHGIIEYEPSEYTFSAYAGTRLDTINQMLSEEGQFLPFDPPLVKNGGTLGGTVAANLCGPGRYRFGGIRDFILGVRFFDPQARMVHFGGKVVKNAAGFDIPKLMVGSLGSLGALVELTFKVFPQPSSYITLISNFSSLRKAMQSLVRVTTSPIEVYCLEVEPKKESYDLRMRIGGIPELFKDRIDRLKEYVSDIEILEGDAEIKYWEDTNEFAWIPKDSVLVKVPLTPKLLPELDTFLKKNEVIRRYSVGANITWIAWNKPLEILDQHLRETNLVGLTILGSPEKTHLGAWDAGRFYQRIKKALDPTGKWAEV